MVQTPLRPERCPNRLHRDRPNLSREPLQGTPQRARLSQFPREDRLEAAVLPQHPPHSQKQYREIRGHVEPIDEPTEEARRAPHFQGRNETRWGGPHPLEQQLELGLEEIRPPISQACRQKRHDFHVARIRVAARQLHRIESDSRRHVGAPDKRVEPRTQLCSTGGTDDRRVTFHLVSSRTACPNSGRINSSIANRAACGDPGSAKRIIPRQVPASARESMAGLPISSNDKGRKISPNPGSSFSSIGRSVSIV